jgi:hypothetical protein
VLALTSLVSPDPEGLIDCSAGIGYGCDVFGSRKYLSISTKQYGILCQLVAYAIYPNTSSDLITFWARRFNPAEHDSHYTNWTS